MEFVFCSFSSTRLDLVFSNKLISYYYSLLHSFSLSHSKWWKKKKSSSGCKSSVHESASRLFCQGKEFENESCSEQVKFSWDFGMGPNSCYLSRN